MKQKNLNMNRDKGIIIFLLILFLPFASGFAHFKECEEDLSTGVEGNIKVIEIRLDMLRRSCDTLSEAGIILAKTIAELAIKKNRAIISEWRMDINKCNLNTAKQMHEVFLSIDSSSIKRSKIHLTYSEEEYVTFYISTYEYEGEPKSEIDTTGFPKLR